MTPHGVPHITTELLDLGSRRETPGTEILDSNLVLSHLLVSTLGRPSLKQVVLRHDGHTLTRPDTDTPTHVPWETFLKEVGLRRDGTPRHDTNLGPGNTVHYPHP